MSDRLMIKILSIIFLFTSAQPLAAQEAPDLESKAKGVIERRCLACHNAELLTAGLDLSSLQTALKGGKSGPALQPKLPDESLIVRKIFEDQMPPGNPLPKEERDVLRQ
jgi:uncharacterized membrane protein